MKAFDWFREGFSYVEFDVSAKKMVFSKSWQPGWVRLLVETLLFCVYVATGGLAVYPLFPAAQSINPWVAVASFVVFAPIAYFSIVEVRRMGKAAKLVREQIIRRGKSHELIDREAKPIANQSQPRKLRRGVKQPITQPPSPQNPVP